MGHRTGPATACGVGARRAKADCRYASNRSAPCSRLRDAPVFRRGPDAEGVEFVYESADWTPPEGERLTDALYEQYGLQSIRIAGAQPHPTGLVRSVAVASVAPPKPSYRPHLPASLVTQGVLSDTQIADEPHDA